MLGLGFGTISGVRACRTVSPVVNKRDSVGSFYTCYSLRLAGDCIPCLFADVGQLRRRRRRISVIFVATEISVGSD